jgi:DNA-directed RNA polymerase subunit alpha
MTNFERLILEVWTDGTIHPNDALTQAAAILTEHFQHLASFGQEVPAAAGKQPLAARPLPSQEAEMSIEDLNLSARAENSLKRAGITKVGQVVNMNPDDLMSIRNFGQKSYTELIERLKLRKLVPDEAPVLAYNPEES